MSEKFGGENPIPPVEAPAKETEKEPELSMEQVMAGMKEMGLEAEKFVVTREKKSPEGKLLSADFRAPGSTSGYTYRLKGIHGMNDGGTTTVIEGYDFAGPDSEDVEYAWTVAEHENGAWKKG